MTVITPDVCLRLCAIRKEQGRTQSSIAQIIGCKQSAISMFENGDPAKLSLEKVEKLASALNIKLAELGGGGKASPAIASSIQGYCPNCNCLSNFPFEIAGKLILKPDRALASPNAGKRCVICGEVLETACPECGAPLNEGICCAACGAAYVTPCLAPSVNQAEWIAHQRKEISLFHGTSAS